MADDDLTAALEKIKGRRETRKQYGLGFDPADALHLLAAVEAVLKLHVRQEKPVRSYAHCPVHAFNPETRRFGGFEDVRACPDCTYTEYYVCLHCECPNDRWPCPTVQRITRELTRKDGSEE